MPEGTSPAPDWRWQHVLQAPHRLGFLLALAVLAAAGAWWTLLQLDRAGIGPGLPLVVSPSLAHAAVMSFGFMPLFFAGFLFTAGPKWLQVPPPAVGALLPALAAQAAGWLLWLAGAHTHVAVAVAGAALAAGGLAAVTLRFWRLVLASRMPDRMHPKTVACALAAGCACLAGLALALAAGEIALARLFVLTGLWSFVVVVFMAVAHRMIPFFSTDALAFMQDWRGGWMLSLLVGGALFEAAAAWLDTRFGGGTAWLLLRGGVELAAGAFLLSLAIVWALAKRLKARLLVMMHVGLVWLGLAFALGGASQLLAAVAQAPVLPLAALHALTMGCLGSLTLAMVTRVAAGHGGHGDPADNVLWLLFWLLQAAVLLRLAASVAPMPMLLVAAAALWAATLLAWGLRLANWLGRARAGRQRA